MTDCGRNTLFGLVKAQNSMQGTVTVRDGQFCGTVCVVWNERTTDIPVTVLPLVLLDGEMKFLAYQGVNFYNDAFVVVDAENIAKPVNAKKGSANSEVYAESKAKGKQANAKKAELQPKYELEAKTVGISTAYKLSRVLPHLAIETNNDARSAQGKATENNAQIEIDSKSKTRAAQVKTAEQKNAIEITTEHSAKTAQTKKTGCASTVKIDAANITPKQADSANGSAFVVPALLLRQKAKEKLAKNAVSFAIAKADATIKAETREVSPWVVQDGTAISIFGAYEKVQTGPNLRIVSRYK